MEIKLVFAIFNNIEYGEAVCIAQRRREKETIVKRWKIQAGLELKSGAIESQGHTQALEQSIPATESSAHAHSITLEPDAIKGLLCEYVA